jgi:hypothetical protein
MPLPTDLLEQAGFLAQREQQRPRQASLRRAVSTAYYAVFHLLASAAASQATPATPAGLSERVQRSLEHGAMKEAAKRFESGNLPDHIRPLVTNPLPTALIAVARTFVRLHEERHKADYDVASRFGRARAQDAVALATQLFRDWDSIRSTDDARVFLASLMFWKVWSK